MAVSASDTYNSDKWKQVVDETLKGATGKDTSGVRWPERSRVNLEHTYKQYLGFLENKIKIMGDSDPLKAEGIELHEQVKDYKEGMDIKVLESNIKRMEDYLQNL